MAGSGSPPRCSLAAVSLATTLVRSISSSWIADWAVFTAGHASSRAWRRAASSSILAMRSRAVGAIWSIGCRTPVSAVSFATASETAASEASDARTSSMRRAAFAASVVAAAISLRAVFEPLLSRQQQLVCTGSPLVGVAGTYRLSKQRVSLRLAEI